MGVDAVSPKDGRYPETRVSPCRTINNCTAPPDQKKESVVMTETKKLKAIIVDDEPPARNKIHELLKLEPDIEVIGECSNGREAVLSIATNSPDIVFLDIQMPELDCFGVVEALGA